MALRTGSELLRVWLYCFVTRTRTSFMHAGLFWVQLKCERNPGRFGPESFRPGRFGLGRFGLNLDVGRFGLFWWVVSALGRFGP